MDHATFWFLIIGVLFFSMALASSFMKGLPLSTAVVYLAIGVALGPIGAGLMAFDPVGDAKLLERVTEVVVLISLFAAGLKLRLPFTNPKWLSAVRLAFLSMALTVGAVAAIAYWVLNLPLGAAVLLGAVLSPTDPVLASGVQVHGPEDQDQLRFSLTGEAGLNDGAAFPFVMLGLGLLGLHDIGTGGQKWLLVDLVWASVAGLAIGALAGTLAARLTTRLRHMKRETVILDDFLALGLIAFSYGAALALNAYGFLAVFAAGLTVRREERVSSGERKTEYHHVIAATASVAPERVKPELTSAVLARNALVFDEQLERIGEVTTVLLVGSMLSFKGLKAVDLLLIPFLLLVVRPLAVYLGLLRDSAALKWKRYISWFGIRGIGSLYYLMFAIQHGVAGELAQRLSALVLSAVAVSIIVHGISVTPLMARYQKQREREPRCVGAT